MSKKIAFRWYFGGLASAGATCVTHPLDLIKFEYFPYHPGLQTCYKLGKLGGRAVFQNSYGQFCPYPPSNPSHADDVPLNIVGLVLRFKVHLQTQHKANIGFAGMAVRVISVSGFMALYSGLSASLCRQLTYSVTRFAIYHSLRDHIIHGKKRHLPFYQKVYLAALGGFIGGFVGTPADVVNVSYSHVLNGFTRIIKEEGFSTLFSGATLASSRGALMTVGQASFYDEIKQMVLTWQISSDSLSTHVMASFIAGLCATFLCQPLDVLKTRMMNAQDYDGIIHCASETAKLGPLAFYKGMFPAAIRLIPHTVLTFVFLEQLRLNFGIPVKSDLGQD